MVVLISVPHGTVRLRPMRHCSRLVPKIAEMAWTTTATDGSMMDVPVVLEKRSRVFPASMEVGISGCAPTEFKYAVLDEMNGAIGVMRRVRARSFPKQKNAMGWITTAMDREMRAARAI
jgi:hypothetical protein